MNGVNELKEQIAYIEEWIAKCKKECEPLKNDRERGELLGYNTAEAIIKNSKNKERRDYDRKAFEKPKQDKISGPEIGAKKLNKIRDRLKIGQYEPIKVEKGVNETILPLKEGEIFWTIRMDKYGLFDAEDQETAMLISSLVRIENKLNKLLKKK